MIDTNLSADDGTAVDGNYSGGVGELAAAGNSVSTGHGAAVNSQLADAACAHRCHEHGIAVSTLNCCTGLDNQLGVAANIDSVAVTASGAGVFNSAIANQSQLAVLILACQQVDKQDTVAGTGDVVAVQINGNFLTTDQCSIGANIDVSQQSHDCAVVCCVDSSLQAGVLVVAGFCNEDGLALCGEAGGCVSLGRCALAQSQSACCSNSSAIGQGDGNGLALACVDLDLTSGNEGSVVQIDADGAFAAVVVVVVDPYQTCGDGCILCNDVAGVDMEVVCVHLTAVDGQGRVATHDECLAMGVQSTGSGDSGVSAVPDLVTAQVTFDDHIHVVAPEAQPDDTVNQVEVDIFANGQSVIVGGANCEVTGSALVVELQVHGLISGDGQVSVDLEVEVGLHLLADICQDLQLGSAVVDRILESLQEGLEFNAVDLCHILASGQNAVDPLVISGCCQLDSVSLSNDIAVAVCILQSSVGEVAAGDCNIRCIVVTHHIDQAHDSTAGDGGSASSHSQGCLAAGYGAAIDGHSAGLGMIDTNLSADDGTAVDGNYSGGVGELAAAGNSVSTGHGAAVNSQLADAACAHRCHEHGIAVSTLNCCTGLDNQLGVAANIDSVAVTASGAGVFNSAIANQSQLAVLILACQQVDKQDTVAGTGDVVTVQINGNFLTTDQCITGANIDVSQQSNGCAVLCGVDCSLEVFVLNAVNLCYVGRSLNNTVCAVVILLSLKAISQCICTGSQQEGAAGQFAFGILCNIHAGIAVPGLDNTVVILDVSSSKCVAVDSIVACGFNLSMDSVTTADLNPNVVSATIEGIAGCIYSVCIVSGGVLCEHETIIIRI